jgi:4-hydroxy-4-methyl-2-oxoglutarate aldolase
MKRMSLVLSVLLFSVAAEAQIFQFTRDQMIEYTKDNPYDRFPDGRPKASCIPKSI